jgi:hypothetical protein
VAAEDYVVLFMQHEEYKDAMRILDRTSVPLPGRTTLAGSFADF